MRGLRTVGPASRWRTLRDPSAVPSEPTAATTGPRVTLTDRATPGFLNGDSHPYTPEIEGGVITYRGVRWTGSSPVQVYGSGAAVSKYRFLDCDFPNGLSAYGSLPEIELVHCSSAGTIGSGSPKGTLDHCRVMSRSTCLQYGRALPDNSPGGTHRTPWLVQDSVLWVMGPLVGGVDHSEVLHVGLSSGSDGFVARRNSMRIPVNPSAAGSYADGVTGLVNFDGPNANALLEQNWCRAFTGSNFLYLNGTDLAFRDNLIYLAQRTSPQVGGGAGAAAPSIYADSNTDSTRRVLTGNAWMNDGAPVTGWS